MSVADTIAKAQGNVIKLEHNQFVSTNRNAAVELRITMESFGTEHKREILKALEDKGYKPKSISAKLYEGDLYGVSNTKKRGNIQTFQRKSV